MIIRFYGFSYTLLCILCVQLFACCSTNEKDAQSDESVSLNAQLLKIEDFPDGVSVIEVKDSKDTSKVSERYILVPKDMDMPDNLPEGVCLRVPLERSIVYSSIYSTAFSELKSEHAVIGVADANFNKTPFIEKGLLTGQILNIGSSSSPSVEKILSLNPDAIILSKYDGMDNSIIERLKFPIIRMADNLELYPLGRAEWIRFLGRLTGKGEMSDSIFRQVQKSYDSLKHEIKPLQARPKVMTELMYEGIWYVPAGESYQAHLIQDAGGDYIFSYTNGSGSLPLSFEQVFEKGNDSDVWLIRLFNEKLNSEKLVSKDKRYSYFKPFIKKTIYYSDSSETSIFEDTAFHPERLLQEYALIFGYLKDKNPVYYTKID